MAKKYLVTGAPGWLGTRFLRALCGNDDAFEVRCLVQQHLSARVLEDIHPKIKIYPGDITEPDTLESFFRDSNEAVLFHLAGIIHSTQGTRQFFKINTEGSKNVLAAAVKNKVGRIIAVSSSVPIGTNPHRNHLFTEDSPYNPYLAYGRSKMEMEILMREAHRKGWIETVILRPCRFYGPGAPERLIRFISMVQRGIVPIVGNGENKQSMCYLDSLCQALLLAAGYEKAAGQTYWIADRRPYTTNEIADTIESVLAEDFGLKVIHRRLRLPRIAASTAYGVDWLLQKFGLYQQQFHILSEMDKSIACSIEKAEKELGYRPMTDLREGMRRTVEWCLENGKIC